MCFGVRDAIALAHDHAEAGPLTILGELVHNPTVLSGLEAKGIAVARDVADVRTGTLMMTAHGASERSLARTRALDRFDVVLDDDDVLALEAHPRIGVAAQTTQPVEKVRHVVGLTRQRFPTSDVRFVDTVCKPTKERQSAAVELARQADVVVVVGGAGSNNTRELVRTCARHCARVHHVQTDADVRVEWLEAAQVVGLTARTSTPDDVIDRVETRIRQLARVEACN